MKNLIAIPLVMLSSTAFAQDVNVSSGSGIMIGSGDILTNFHVVDQCNKIEVKLPTDVPEKAVLIAQDPKNDLAVVRINTSPKRVASFREGAPVRVGETVLALGYPLSGLLASSANLSVGIVSALAGLGDDSRFIQISAPVQPGNSGGPLVDTSGHVVGIVTSKLNAIAVAAFTGNIPENINFAIKAEVAKAFLESRGIKYSTAVSDREIPTADVADLAKPFTAYIECTANPTFEAIAPLTPPASTQIAATPEPSVWDHNGSIVYLVAKGSSREFYYKQPRPGMLEAGAGPGSLLFRGQSIKGQYSGTAYIFKRGCGQIPYQVSGPIIDNYRRVVLTGQAPRVGPNCQIQGYFKDILDFRLMESPGG